ncbi:hypothetical protein QUF75_16420 [Desulfococcaceae bacterium HSG7]|nr:hypothetical protein [Desulfococcaceae bacterium HSG7]
MISRTFPEGFKTGTFKIFGMSPVIGNGNRYRPGSWLIAALASREATLQSAIYKNCGLLMIQAIRRHAGT